MRYIAFPHFSIRPIDHRGKAIFDEIFQFSNLRFDENIRRKVLQNSFDSEREAMAALNTQRNKLISTREP